MEGPILKVSGFLAYNDQEGECKLSTKSLFSSNGGRKALQRITWLLTSDKSILPPSHLDINPNLSLISPVSPSYSLFLFALHSWKPNILYIRQLKMHSGKPTLMEEHTLAHPCRQVNIVKWNNCFMQSSWLLATGPTDWIICVVTVSWTTVSSTVHFECTLGYWLQCVVFC